MIRSIRGVHLTFEVCAFWIYSILCFAPAMPVLATSACQAIGKPDTYNVIYGTIASTPVSAVTVHEFEQTASKFFIRCLSWTETIGIDAAQQSTVAACPRGVPQLCRREVPSSSIPDPPWECKALTMFANAELANASLGTVDGPVSHFRLSWSYTGVAGVVGTCFPRQVVASVVAEVYTKREGSLALFIIFIIFFVVFFAVGACYLCLVLRRWSSGKFGAATGMANVAGPGIAPPKQPMGRYKWNQADAGGVNPIIQAGLPANNIVRVNPSLQDNKSPYTNNPIKSALAENKPTVVPHPVLRSFDQYRDVDQDSDEEEENQEDDDVYVCTECGMDVEDRQATPQICPVSKKRHY